MAKIYEEVVVIKLSKLVREDAEVTSLVNAETVAALEQVAQELVGTDIIVEAQVA